MEKDYNSIVERLLEAPHWVIDMLPQQVSPDSLGQFFAVEKYYLNEYYNDRPLLPLYRQFRDVLLKLNCYHDLVVNYAPNDKWVKNPEPAQLYSWLTKSLGHAHLCVLVDDEEALITASSGDSYLTLYNPSEELVKLVGQLATAAGLFLWQPPCENEWQFLNRTNCHPYYTRQLASQVNELLGAKITPELLSQIRKEVADIDGVHGVFDIIDHNYSERCSWLFKATCLRSKE